MYSRKDEVAGNPGKIHTTGGDLSNGTTEERDVEFVKMEIGTMKKHLIEEWGFKF